MFYVHVKCKIWYLCVQGNAATHFRCCGG